MGKVKNIIAGFVGAAAMNILHESLKRKSSTPKIDLLGEQALNKGLAYFGEHIDDEKQLYRATLVSDLISNTVYYSLIGSGKQKYIWAKVFFFGLSAGIGAITLPKPMGLDEAPVAETDSKKALTVSYYLFGAIVTGLLIKAMKNK
ncbi:MAG: hypothetical protein EOO20_12685 [Chryseobacterium sp.]|nr:MAG: hypothetical protein EOO20_12685 [Chryseobacterium sp.]